MKKKFDQFKTWLASKPKWARIGLSIVTVGVTLTAVIAGIRAIKNRKKKK